MSEIELRLADAEDTMNKMRAECLLAPGVQHDPIECAKSWRVINCLWSRYQRKHILKFNKGGHNGS